MHNLELLRNSEGHCLLRPNLYSTSWVCAMKKSCKMTDTPREIFLRKNGLKLEMSIYETQTSTRTDQVSQLKQDYRKPFPVLTPALKL